MFAYLFWQTIGGFFCMSKSILFIDPGHAFGVENYTHPFMQQHFDFVDMYDFTQIDLTPYKAIVVHDFVDQIYLANNREIIEHFLHAGNIVIWSGHLTTHWLPGCALFQPKPIEKFSDYNISIVEPHEVFDGVTTVDMTLNKGVAGFFARGAHLPLPANAQPLLTLPNGFVTTYIDRHTTNGTLFVHAGRDLFSQRDQNKTTDRIHTQLLAWIHEEHARIQGGRRHA